MAAGKDMTARMFSYYKTCTWNQLPDDKRSPNNADDSEIVSLLQEHDLVVNGFVMCNKITPSVNVETKDMLMDFKRLTLGQVLTNGEDIVLTEV